MDPDRLYARYVELQHYVGWTGDDAARVALAAPLVRLSIGPMIDDFYEEISHHPDARKVITGGPEQIERLKQTLRGWLLDLLSGPYDRDYVARRWRVGWRHVEIGLDQVYTNAALSRLRSRIAAAIVSRWQGRESELREILESIHKLLDLDLAIIEDAYQTEYLSRQQQVERLAAIGHMAGGVAHELRQPLNVIRSSAYYLQHAGHALPPKAAEHLERIDRQVALANGVITSMSDFARMPLPEVRPIRLADILAQTMEATRLPAGIAVRQAGNLEARVLADPGQLGIVLGNLIRNAGDAMPDGGALTIELRPAEQFVEIDIADTGKGIHPNDLPHIMEPMYTTKPRGIGLGLTISRAIVQKHGGHIRIHSELGKGSIFTLALPVAPAVG